MEKLTIQEEEVMIYVWELQSCFVKDIVAKYPQPAPPYTTVASIVKNLERKGYVTSKRVGNTYQYTPAIRENEYKRHFMSSVVRNYFENSYKEMVSFFAKDQKLSTDDLKDIIELIEKRKRKLIENIHHHDSGISLFSKDKCSNCFVLRLLSVVLS